MQSPVSHILIASSLRMQQPDATMVMTMMKPLHKHYFRCGLFCAARAIADEFMYHDPKFDRESFYKSCGFTPEDVRDISKFC